MNKVCKVTVLLVVLLSVAAGQIHRRGSAVRQHGIADWGMVRRTAPVACPDPVPGTYTGTAASMTDAATTYTAPAECYD